MFLLVLNKFLILSCFLGQIHSKNTVKNESQTLSCQIPEEKNKNSPHVVSFDKFECGKKQTGEYSHEIELLDGTKHKELGVIINGKLSIRGYFLSKTDSEKIFFYTNDEKGFHYYEVPIGGSNATQEYAIGDEDDDCIPSGRNENVCLDPSARLSLLGG